MTAFCRDKILSVATGAFPQRRASGERTVARMIPLGELVCGVKTHIALGSICPAEGGQCLLRAQILVEFIDQFRSLLPVFQVHHAGPIGARLLGE